MNKYLLSLFFFFSSLAAFSQMEIQKGLEGKTFYDSSHIRIREAYEYKVRYRVMIDPKTNDMVTLPNPEEIKNGLYIYYREDGTIDHTGYFKNGVKCGKWVYYDASGKTSVREESFPGDCVLPN